MPKLLILEVVATNLDGLAFGLQLAADGLEVADKLTLLGIHADHGLASRDRRGDRLVDVRELRVASGWLAPSRVFLLACRL
jgi:hypothetical protein